LRNGLDTINGVTCTDIGREKCGIITFKKENWDSAKLKNSLFEKGIYTSASFPSATLIDSEKRGLDYLVRASIHYYNTEQEIDELLNVLET